MMICNCTLAGTQACKNCLRYKEYFGEQTVGFTSILEAQTVDLTKVLCRDCKHYNPETKGCKRNPSVQAWEEKDFCSYGERRK